MLTRFKLWAGAALGVAVALWAAWMAVRREARQEARTEALEGYAKTRKDMDDADTLGDDVGLARRFLHERAKSGGDL